MSPESHIYKREEDADHKSRILNDANLIRDGADITNAVLQPTEAQLAAMRQEMHVALSERNSSSEVEQIADASIPSERVQTEEWYAGYPDFVKTGAGVLYAAEQMRKITQNVIPVEVEKLTPLISGEYFADDVRWVEQTFREIIDDIKKSSVTLRQSLQECRHQGPEIQGEEGANSDAGLIKWRRLKTKVDDDACSIRDQICPRLEELLGVCLRGSRSAGEETERQAWITIKARLKSICDQCGIEVIEPLEGEPFDETKHQVAQIKEDAGQKSLTIAEVSSIGIQLPSRTQKAKVVVYK